MEYQIPKTKCNLCSSEFTGRGIAKHLKSCIPRHLQTKSKQDFEPFYHIHVKTAPNSDYFLHLLASENITLETLDSYLRQIWLECCGHLSAFSYERFGEEIDKDIWAKDIFEPGMELHYVYDYGSSTELKISVNQIYHITDYSAIDIKLIARNAQPIIPCDQCHNQPAMNICLECTSHEDGWLCESCFEKHECDEEMSLPIVNSPRTGVCGYTGMNFA